MVYGRRQPRTKNASFEFRRRQGSNSAHEITEYVPELPRRSKRAAERINLPRGAMRIEDFEPESTSSDDEEESPYRQEPTPPESPTAAAQCKRKGKNIRVGDSPEGPLKTEGILLKTCKKQNQNTPPT
jgi:hypothetical protein